MRRMRPVASIAPRRAPSFALRRHPREGGDPADEDRPDEERDSRFRGNDVKGFGEGLWTNWKQPATR